MKENGKLLNEEALYRLYLDERKLLYEGECHQADSFDKAILTLSSSALGVSLVILNTISNTRRIENIWILIISWILFLLSILSTLLSFRSSQREYAEQLNYIEQYLFSKTSLKQKRMSKSWTTVFNYLSLISFFCAIILFIVFIVNNFWKI